MAKAIDVYGPAYLDRVLRVEGPLHEPGVGPPLDQSVDGHAEFAEKPTSELILRDPDGGTLVIQLPEGWPGPWGAVRLSRPLKLDSGAWERSVPASEWHDDLGGMGAGYASALGGRLVSVLGAEADPTSRAIEGLLAGAAIPHQPIRVADQPADWTLLVTSGPHGDKLPIGFRGCHSAVDQFPGDVLRPCDLRVACALSNRLVSQVLNAPGAALRAFAPSSRNMVDRSPAIAEFAGAIDILCCNRREWESLEDREEVAWRVALLVVTDGPNGSTLRFTTPEGEPGLVKVPAMTRMRPPRDTNRAGEAYASTLIQTLLAHRWSSGVIDTALVREAAERAAAASALELDLTLFRFPAPAEIDAALRAGHVA